MKKEPMAGVLVGVCLRPGQGQEKQELATPPHPRDEAQRIPFCLTLSSSTHTASHLSCSAFREGLPLTPGASWPECPKPFSSASYKQSLPCTSLVGTWHGAAHMVLQQVAH